MRVWRVLVLAVVLAVGLMPVVASAVHAGSISGTVTAEATGAPLPGVWVYVLDLAGNSVARAETDAVGHYTVGGLPSGDYQVLFAAPFYVLECWDNRPSRPGPVAWDPVTVVQGADHAGIDAALVRSGSISGTVVAEGSLAPIEGVEVEFCAAWSNFCWVMFTNAAGRYSITWLEPGDWTVGFIPADPHAFVSEWYNNKPDRGSADLITVHASDDILGIDAVLSPPSLISVGTFDGWVLEQDETSGKGGTFDAAATTGRVGDDALDRQYRSILHFDTATLPDNAVITGVTLRIRKQSVVGTDPFDTHGFLTVDMRTGAYRDNPALEKFDFQAVGSRGNVGRFVKVASDGWYRAPLRAVSYPLINLTGSTQFRLRFAIDDNDDLGADYLSFYTGDAAEADRPELIVTYYVP